MEEENSLSMSVRESSMVEGEGPQQSSSSSEWCTDSEIRLFKKLLSHKPAGKFFMMNFHKSHNFILYLHQYYSPRTNRNNF